MFKFNNPYNRADFVNFLEINFLPDDFQPQEEKIHLNFAAKYTSSVSRLGVCKSLDLDVFEINHNSTHDARIGISKEAFKLMQYNSLKNKALIAFIPNGEKQYRFSLLQIEASQDDNSSRIQYQYSNPRRYSYILGEKAHTKTPEQYLYEKGQLKNADDLQHRFSIEVLTRQFYRELFAWYQWAVSDEMEVTYPNDTSTASDDRIIEEHIIRLITRLMFVWFIKQKQLVPDNLFDKNKLQKVLKNFNPYDYESGNYYNGILQNLFFATLNNEISQRAFATDRTFHGKAEDYGIKTLFRNPENDSWFKISNKEVLKLFEDVPFLNGGLFECLDKETPDSNGKIIYSDGFSRKAGKQKRAFIPNVLFFEEEKGLISILNKYNFTVEENTSQDVEVALDPELLGKVFENLLGAYNPETKETARKQSGSFYTPREIVNYMVDESLISYLGDTPTIRELFSKEELPNELKNKPQERFRIREKLKVVKILDPACGSGAFPMGILNRLVNVLNKLNQDNKETVYEQKLHLIENCVYGIDIQTIAVQISKLRFFISLICEQEKDNTKENFGIPTLPNLETKFVSANTLISLDREKKDQIDLHDTMLEKMKDELLEIRNHLNLRASSRQEKVKLRNEDKKLCERIEKYLIENTIEPDEKRIAENRSLIQRYEAEILDLKEEWVDEYETQMSIFGSKTPQKLFQKDLNKPKRDKLNEIIKLLKVDIQKEKRKAELTGLEKTIHKMTAWDPYNQNVTSPFFDAEWMFGLNSGFDIIIGNPPYFSLTTDSTQKDKNGKFIKHNKIYENSQFMTFDKSGDIYCLFYERAWQLLKPKGRLCFITSNKWMRVGYGESTRKFFAENTNPEQLIDFAGIKIFESATVDTNILMFSKDKNRQQTKACVVKNKSIKDLSVYFRQNANISNFSGAESWVVLSTIEKQIKEKIKRIGTPLKDWDVRINYGIKTGYNEAFIITGAKRDELIKQDPKSAEIIRPILRGKDIRRYRYSFEDQYLLAIFPALSFDIDQYPAIKSHLLTFGKKKLDENGYNWVAENYLEEWCYKRLEQTGKEIIINNQKIVFKDNTKSRKKTTNKWFETQDSIGYWEDLNRPKIVWGEISDSTKFCIDLNGEFATEATTFLMTGQSLLYLLGFLNSKLSEYLFSKLGTTTGVGTIRWKKYTIEQLPIPIVSTERQNEYEIEVMKIIKHTENHEEVILKINNLIYSDLQLTKDEIAFIESR